jgi:hydroxycarboxylate dehydrogenase B
VTRSVANNMFAVLVDPAAPVLVPGDPERMARDERAGTGIYVDATTWDEILQAGEKLGLARAESEALIA